MSQAQQQLGKRTRKEGATGEGRVAEKKTAVAAKKVKGDGARQSAEAKQSKSKPSRPAKEEEEDEEEEVEQVGTVTSMKCEQFAAWLSENEQYLKPPVCNKLMFGGQQKVMFIGGKSDNERTDYHIEEGEEIFFQMKGDMVLKIIEKGRLKDIHIKEGDLFLLPPRIPHSPQRKKGTIGMVIERERRPRETDGLRWYVPGTLDVLYEKWFHCEDLGKQLGPVIREFQASNACKTKIPNLTDGSVLTADQIPYPTDFSTEVEPPLNFFRWVDTKEDDLKRGPLKIFEGKDFRIDVLKNFKKQGHNFPGEHKGETFLYLLKGAGHLVTGDGATALAPDSMVLLSPNTKYTMKLEPGSSCIRNIWYSCD